MTSNVPLLDVEAFFALVGLMSRAMDEWDCNYRRQLWNRN